VQSIIIICTNPKTKLPTVASVGIGRTGTFIAVFQLNEALNNMKNLRNDNYCMQTYSNLSILHDEIVPGLPAIHRKNLRISGGLDVFKTVLALRCRRMNMVEAPEQYAYLYMYAEMKTRKL